MAESNSNIGIRVGGDITPLQQSLKKGSGLISDFTSLTNKASKIVGALGIATNVVSVGGMAAMFKSTAANAREIKNFASVANTSVEQMQRMAYGAKGVDVSMEKLADILKDTNDRIGDFAATGGGPMADFFENIAPKVGLTIDQFKRLSGPEALQAYYSALENANLNQQEMTFYLEALASDTTKLIPLLKNGGAGFSDMAREADELGIVMSGIDVAKIDAATKSLNRAGAIAKGAGKAFSVELAPFVEAAVDQFVELAKESGGFGNIAEKSISKAIRVVGFMADSVHGLKVVFKGLHLAAAAVGTGIAVVFNEVTQKVNDLMASMIGGVNSLTEQLSRIPGVDIDAIGLPTFGAKVQDITDSSVANLKRLRSEFDALAMQSRPSEVIEQLLNTVKSKAQEDAEEVAKVASGVMVDDQQGGGMAGADPRIEALKERYLTEEELLRQHRETMALIGDEYDATQFESESQWQSVRSQAMQEHINKMRSLREAEKTSAINIAESLGSSLMQLAQGQSRRAFEIGKKVAVASATVKGIQSAVDAWQAGMSTGGPWAPAIAAGYAAASLVKTGAMIRSINSQQYQGGGGQPAAPSGGIPSVATGGAIPNAGGDTASSIGSTTIALPLDGIVTDMAGLIKRLNEAQSNGEGRIEFVGV